MAWIDKLVSHSPIGLIQEHMQAAVACARRIEPLIEAMASGDATVYWHQIVLRIADAADYAERVGNRLRLLIAN